MRIVSLLPSATEIVYALGRGTDLVGRSEECDFPPDARKLPVVMRARSLDTDRGSAEIDERVRATRGAGESLYHLDLDRLQALAPEIVLTQDLCGVCSVTEAEVSDACRRSGIAPNIVSLTPRRLEEVWGSVQRVGEAIGAGGSADRLTAQLQRRSRSNDDGQDRPRVALVEWLDPPILAGLWSPDIVSAAGGRSVGPSAGAPGERTSWETIGASHPDLVVLAPCSFSVDRTLQELSVGPFADRVARLRAVRGVYVADEAYFSRPGPRLADGIDLVRNLLSGNVSGPMPVTRWDPGTRGAG